MKSRIEAWNDLLLRKYLTFGIQVSFTSPVAAQTVSLRMIDMTKGVETGDGFAHVPTVTPVAAVMSSALSDLGITPGDMMNVCFSFEDTQWQIKSFSEKPGVGNSEVYFMLETV